jgi:hypothetical protein
VQRWIVKAPTRAFATATASPAFAHIVVLEAPNLRDDFGDGQAVALAASPHAAGLRWIDFTNCAIGRAGVEALAASPHLANVRYMCFDGNPCDPTPQLVEIGSGSEMQQPPVARELVAKFGARAWLTGPVDGGDWPPMPDQFLAHD